MGQRALRVARSCRGGEGTCAQIASSSAAGAPGQGFAAHLSPDFAKNAMESG